MTRPKAAAARDRRKAAAEETPASDGDAPAPAPAAPPGGPAAGIAPPSATACALSEPGGRGLGTLGFSERVAREMVLGRGLFTECRVLHEADNTRWFEVTR